MESIGDKLRSQREQKGYSIEQIARDTNIAKRYLEALEAEDFSVFPGDPYLIGFLRNYADYLGIEPDDMVALYKNFQIQSQPLPLEELLIKRDKRPIFLILGAVLIVAVLIVGGYFLFPLIFPPRDRSISTEPETNLQTDSGTIYELADEILERRFLEKDTIVVDFKESEYHIELSNISDRLTLTVPGGTNVLRIGEERAIDLDGDAKMDIKVFLNDIDSSAKTPSAVLRLDKFVKTATVAEPVAGESPVLLADSTEAGSVVGVPLVSDRQVPTLLIREANVIEAFSVSIIFRGYCLFRYIIDGVSREERYFHKGDTLEMDVSRELRMWISNAGNLKARVAGNDVELGKLGEVSTRMVQWVQDEGSQTYKLQVLPLY